MSESCLSTYISYISPISRLYLTYISPISRLYLAYTSPIPRLYLTHERELPLDVRLQLDDAVAQPRHVVVAQHLLGARALRRAALQLRLRLGQRAAVLLLGLTQRAQLRLRLRDPRGHLPSG